MSVQSLKKIKLPLKFSQSRIRQTKFSTFKFPGKLQSNLTLSLSKYFLYNFHFIAIWPQKIQTWNANSHKKIEENFIQWNEDMEKCKYTCILLKSNIWCVLSTFQNGKFWLHLYFWNFERKFHVVGDNRTDLEQIHFIKTSINICWAKDKRSKVHLRSCQYWIFL